MLIIDRIEGDFAVCEQEDRSHISISLAELPEVHAGDVLVESETGYLVDSEETEARRARIRARFRRLSDS